MAKKTLQAAREGWFTLDQENPKLIGSCCDQCGTYYFPVHEQFCRNPACESEAFSTVELSSKGKIWSYTNAEYPPPEPFKASDPHEVFAIAAVELEKEKLIIMGQVKQGVSVADIKIGDDVQLILESLYEDDENDYLVWKWQPLQGERA